MKKPSPDKLLLKQIRKALDSFPKIVRQNRSRFLKRKKFVEKTFGPLARRIHREVHGK